MKKFLALYVFAVLAVALGTTTSKAGTIGHWTFEDGTPGTTASGPGTITDISANGLHGTAFGSPSYVSGAVSGFGSTGLNFNGTTDTFRVASGSSGPLAVTGDFTLELGIRANQPSSLGFGVFYGDTQSGKDPYDFFFDTTGRLVFRIYNEFTGTSTISSGSNTIDFGVLTQIAAVFDYDDDDVIGNTDGTTGDDNLMKLYINRELVASLNVGSSQPLYGDTVSDLWIGSVHNNGAQRYFDGDMTDVRISDMALTESEMLLVPEPGMLAIFGVGILALGLTRRKRA